MRQSFCYNNKKNSSHLFSKQLKEGVSWTFDTPSSFLSSTATRQ